MTDLYVYLLPDLYHSDDSGIYLRVSHVLCSGPVAQFA